MLNLVYGLWFLVAAGIHAPPPDLVTPKQYNCLVTNVYREARGESLLGQIAVSKVVLNRVRAEEFPDTICKVVYQPNQFSWTNKYNSTIQFRNKIDISSYSQVQFSVAVSIFLEHLGVAYMDNVKFYHTTKVNPKWGKDMEIVATIGNHVFKKEVM